MTGTLDVVACKLNIGQQCHKDCVRHCPELTVMAPLFPSAYVLPDKTLADQAQPECMDRNAHLETKTGRNVF